MKKIFMHKRALLLSVVAIMAVTATAIAYWTTSGSGTDSADVDAGAANLTVTETTTLSDMYPGDSPQELSGTVKNNGTAEVRVDSVTASIVSVDQAVGAVGSCDADDFLLTSPQMSVSDNDLSNNETVTFDGAQIQFNNKPVANQDGCKDATVNLKYTVDSA